MSLDQLSPHFNDKAEEERSKPVPCAARPSTNFVHLNGPCNCFFGGEAPEFGGNGGNFVPRQKPIGSFPVALLVSVENNDTPETLYLRQHPSA